MPAPTADHRVPHSDTSVIDVQQERDGPVHTIMVLLHAPRVCSRDAATHAATMKGTAVAMRLTDVLIKVLDRAPGQVKGNAVNYAMASLKGVRGYGDGFAMDYLYVRVDGFANSPMPFVYMDGVAALCAHYASEKRQAMLLVRLSTWEWPCWRRTRPTMVMTRRSVKMSSTSPSHCCSPLPKRSATAPCKCGQGTSGD